MVVGAQNQNGVFESDDEKERPENKRHGAYHRFGRGRPAGVDGLFQSVQRAGADIAVDNSKCRQHRGGGQLVGILPRPPLSLKDLSHAHVPSDGCAKYA